MDDVWANATAGSPPQVRGKHKFEVDGGEYLGITPAGAGKTKAKFGDAVFIEDHPRRCGENSRFFCANRRCTGSPPQVRGKPIARLEQSLHIRITPAGAGKTRLQPH